MPPAAIESAAGISARTVGRVLSLWRKAGDVMKKAVNNGRPRVLTSLESSFYLASYRGKETDIQES
ncbi:hypothetical protein BDQ12DRAFT_729431 [Crucibulum laeve]|uniref:Uncharacterized protein n=1 Tax=Crucibulum laeve TaxID=68775 RepID=A0A5C3LFJ3_9AGAR|nr:hypothetical protein BDQ12DRAFT_729431 [Crucibulum laeve]